MELGPRALLPLVYVVPFVLFAAGAYAARRPARPSLRGWLAFTVPWALVRHRSTLVDTKLLLGNLVFVPFLRGWSALLLTLVTTSVNAALVWAFPREGWLDSTPLPLLGFTVFAALATDFATWVTHVLGHRVPALWALHKLHHSAEVLTPATAFRHHPAYWAVDAVVDAAIAGPALGVAYWAFGGHVAPTTLFGVNLVYAAFQLFGGGLRHSHLWLSLGPALGHVFISPAQHQIHHSAAPRHHDTNFGEVFALWDWAFGTLYVPREHEALTFGLGGPSIHVDLRTAWLRPIREALDALRPGPART